MFMFGVDHSMQMRSCIFDVVVFVLSCSAFRGNHSATMDIFKIAIGNS